MYKQNFEDILQNVPKYTLDEQYEHKHTDHNFVGE